MVGTVQGSSGKIMASSRLQKKISQTLKIDGLPEQFFIWKEDKHNIGMISLCY
jgi:hypothetical protein